MSKYKKIKAVHDYCFKEEEPHDSRGSEWCDFKGEECRYIIDKKTGLDIFDICCSEKVIFKKVSK
jgi:hypothetical protein